MRKLIIVTLILVVSVVAAGLVVRSNSGNKSHINPTKPATVVPSKMLVDDECK